MRILLILVILMNIGCASDQKTKCNYIEDYFPKVYRADLEFDLENYEEAFNLYKDVFSSCDAKNTLGLNEIGDYTESSAILGKFDVTYEYAKKQILNGVELNRFQNNENFTKFWSSEFGKKLESDYEKLRKEYIENVDFNLRDELVSMRSSDQMYRGRNSNSDWTKQDSIDKIHEKKLIEIFETVGYPTDEIVGPNTMNYTVDLGLFLLHTKDSIRMNYFVPKVKGFVENGTAPPRSLGTMIDQFYLYNDEPQIYGTYGAQGGGYANMIDDLEKVDSNRVSIGLQPLSMKEKKDSIRKVKYGF